MPRLHGLAVWLAENAGLSLPALHDAFCRELHARGLPLWRTVLGTETLHPEEMGGQAVWLVDETASLSAFYHGVETTSAYLDSPLKVVDDTGEPFRRRIDGNVGGRRRLDFTVLGPAVNYASRLESCAKEFGRSVVASADFAAALGRPLVPLGTFPLRSFGDAEPVFALPGSD